MQHYGHFGDAVSARKSSGGLDVNDGVHGYKGKKGSVGIEYWVLGIGSRSGE